MWLIGGIEAGNATQSAQTYRVRLRPPIRRVGGLVEPGIFMSNGRAEPENGIGESGEKERGWKMEREREWECGTDLRYVPFMQRTRGRESRVNDL